MKVLLVISLLLISSSSSANELKACNPDQKSEIEVINFTSPSYPADTHYYGNGEVDIQIFLDKEGRITELSILSSNPTSIFERAAVKAVRKSIFSKSLKDAIRCGIIGVEFILKE